ncbi:MAG: uracil-DNA glycosylase [Thermodesulfobacteriota bacterium]
MISLNKEIVNCKKCKRLVEFREKIASEKRKQYESEEYWGKPITGFGEINAQVIIVGLAPAAHGGNRTGRVFTGDKSATFLYRCLNKVGISNLNDSTKVDDGLKLKKTYITTALKCVPPQDKPTANELIECFNFFKQELEELKRSKKIIALGKIAFDACIKYYKKFYNFNDKVKFIHSEKYLMPDNKELYCCYHPSPRNVNTGRINEKMMINFLKEVFEL